jgi:hypothetical protein
MPGRNRLKPAIERSSLLKPVRTMMRHGLL